MIAFKNHEFLVNSQLYHYFVRDNKMADIWNNSKLFTHLFFFFINLKYVRSYKIIFIVFRFIVRE